MPDHDQLMKLLGMEFPAQLFSLFFILWSRLLDFTKVDWLLQEVFSDPPDGGTRRLDLVAKALLRNRPCDRWHLPGLPEWIPVLIHIEFESADRVGESPRRFRWYHLNLVEKYGLPVFTFVVWQNVGLVGLGEYVLEEPGGPKIPLTFRFDYVGLPELDGLEYLNLPNPLAPAMVSMMRVPEDQRVHVRYEAARRIATDETTPRQKHLLFCCLERYLTLSDDQQAEYDRLVASNQAPEVQEMAVTTFEKGIEQGIEQGIEKGIERGSVETLRWTIQVQLKERFGKLPAKARKRIEELTTDELRVLVPKIVLAATLKDLDL